MRQLLDNAGHVWSTRSPALAERLFRPCMTDEVAEYAIRNMGYVEVTVRGHCAYVRFRATRVSPRTLDALDRYLRRQAIERVALTNCGGQGPDRILPPSFLKPLVEDKSGRML
jgi:hypothetical protein